MLLDPARLPTLILASQSPRRAQLLERLGLPFQSRPAHLDEEALDSLPAEELARTLALHKAQAVWRPGEWVVAADTVVALGGELLGKPGSVAENRDFLERLSGQTHTVFTGLTLILPSGKEEALVDAARVRFRALEDWEIEWYASSGEGLDKAGGYGVQERGMVLVDAVEGDFYTVMGLPVRRLWQVLARWGYFRGGEGDAA
ncbi:Septum formation protein Maf [Calidithermus terrae]|uniref:dTTP/UTP pyrophosphatase n=1 Tax=Calidithermus terrae TaxID=1408545 RepID=A0A399EAT2_9DEIN|nr:Maf family protein [Calidithermus terrae]RIH81425.1 Septum formation protein Maf [Calidithermus terrae]